MSRELEQELAFFGRMKRQWLAQHEGEFVAVSGLHSLGFFPDWEQAFRYGVKEVGVSQPFLVKQVLEEEPVYLIFASRESTR